MKKIKNLLLLLLCFPIIFLCSCGKTTITEAINLNYYFSESIACSFFNQTSTRNLTLSDLTQTKPNTDLLDSYAEILLSSHSENSRTYHLYIEKITFYVYTNESSEFDLNVNITIENVIDESQVGSEVEDKTFTDTYSAKPEKNSSIEYSITVNKVVATTTGTSIKFDILTSDIYNTTDDSTVTFKWLIYGLKIFCEPRVYNTTPAST